MVKRLLGVLLVTSFVVGALIVPALATEEGGPEAPPPNIDEICATESASSQFCPEEYVEPSFFQWLSVPLLVVAIVMIAVLLGAYLYWQPKFAEERRAKQR
ncbi:MAG: hypothetical protein ACR2MA_05895 [Egibacteraceae bacterium]